jgi:choline/ethanolamine kinase
MAAPTLKECLRQLDSSNLSKLPSEIREKIHELCADFMGGVWARLEVDEIQIAHIRGGTSNLLFLCSLPDGHGRGKKSVQVFQPPTVPKELLLRVYFNPNTENHVLEESVVFTLLAERKLGPKLYGVFADGRLEEYVHSRPLKTSDIRVPLVSAKIARILAQIHQLTVPVSKRPTFLNDCMRKWMQRIRTIYSAKKHDPLMTIRLEDGSKTQLFIHDLEREISNVIECIQSSPSPVLFCHNDFQEGNVLLPKTYSSLDVAEFGVIDYEYACYNYRAFDIANHFCEWTFDYHENTEHPYFLWTQDTYPNTDQQLVFVRSYLNELRVSRGVGGLSNDHPGTTVAVPEHNAISILEEVKPFVPVSHFLWAVWAVLLAEESPVQFGYMEYAECRMQLYFDLKNDLLALLGVTNGSH